MSSTVRVVRTSFVEAQEEWEQVPVVTLNEKSAALVQGGNFAKSEDNKPTVSHPDLSYREFWEHLLAQYRQHKQKELSKLNSSAHKGFWETLRSFLATIPLPPRTWFGGLSDESLEEKETILHAAHSECPVVVFKDWKV
ncbi:unnamed protein product [Cyprideis torosa]|uniref:Uncharacterized protein n=1 Tax=Cyprideis torosa TaxID=163714 RepID=A0A7R8WLT0_9CRUS|nr:unnamed protein product [Cyprideis torosa]CAG0904665.1 unnamed protein product [Cyprideis torosa]